MSPEQNHQSLHRSNRQPSSPALQSERPVTQESRPSAYLQRALMEPSRLAAADVLYLQRTIGNRAVAQLLPPRPTLQRTVASPIGAQGGAIDNAQAQQIRTPQGSGQAVPEQVRTQVEKKTGADLGAVRVHNNKDSHTLNRQLNARAFTHCNQIFLGHGESPRDVQLMAHELTHTIQQTGGDGRAQRKENKSPAVPSLTSAPTSIQRKTRNFRMPEIEEVRTRSAFYLLFLKELRKLFYKTSTYNEIPGNSQDFDDHIRKLLDIADTARTCEEWRSQASDYDERMVQEEKDKFVDIRLNLLKFRNNVDSEIENVRDQKKQSKQQPLKGQRENVAEYEWVRYEEPEPVSQPEPLPESQPQPVSQPEPQLVSNVEEAPISQNALPPKPQSELEKTHKTVTSGNKSSSKMPKYMKRLLGEDSGI